MSFRIAAGDRVVFIGLPRSGKTNLIAALLMSVRSWVVIDSKRHPDEWAAFAKRVGALVTSDPDEINKRDDKGQLVNPRVVFQISSRALRDRAGWKRHDHVWTRALEAIIARGRRVSTVVVFDEVLQSLPNNAHPLAWEIYEQGRAFGLSAWGGSQVANRMETLVIRLAEHCFCFWTGSPNEQEIIAQARGIDCSELSTLEEHHFAYQRVGPRSSWTLCRPAPLVMKNMNSVALRRSEPEPERDQQPVA